MGTPRFLESESSNRDQLVHDLWLERQMPHDLAKYRIGPRRPGATKLKRPETREHPAVAPVGVGSRRPAAEHYDLVEAKLTCPHPSRDMHKPIDAGGHSGQGAPQPPAAGLDPARKLPFPPAIEEMDRANLLQVASESRTVHDRPPARHASSAG